MGACYFWQSACEIDWPAWVQAVGSIAAILIAIELPRVDERRRRRQVLERIKALVTLATDHCQRFVGILHEREFDEGQNPQVTFGVLQRLIDDFPLERLETAEDIKELVRFRGLLGVVQKKVEANLNTMQRTGRFFPGDIAEADNALADLEASGQKLMAQL